MTGKDFRKIHIGTSGWTYEHWDKGVFYPAKLQSNKKLSYYSHFFSVVEINSTFYHLPVEKTVKTWVRETPADFIFAIKASSYITHLKRLKDPSSSLDLFFQRLPFFKKKLGPILFQLPPSFHRDQNRLLTFLEHLPSKYCYTFEFRHPTWFCDATYELLQKHQVALCITDLNGKLSPVELTSDFTYIRLHGPKKAYQGSYSYSEITRWAKQLLQWNKNKIETFCFFNNDEKGYAIKDAFRLKKRIITAKI